MSTISRRGFLKASSVTAGAAGATMLQSLGFGHTVEAATENILVMVYLRGGADFLNLIVPRSGPDRAHYEAARPDLAISADTTLPLGTSAFGLHPNATDLHNIYTQPTNNLAIVQAAGLPSHTRSHEEATLFMENGTPGVRDTAEGWMVRHLNNDPNLQNSIMMPGLAVRRTPSAIFAGSNQIVTAEYSTYFQSLFRLNGFSLDRNPQRAALRNLYGLENSRVHVAGTQALNASNIIELNASNSYEPPASVAVTYSSSAFNRRMQLAAQMIKLELGLRTVTVDLSDWDTHQGQGTTSGSFWGKVGDLSRGLAAFYSDMAESGGDYAQRVTVCVMSEFGRKLRQNDDSGCDHGHGGAMLVLGGAVNGGLYGSWPGLDHAALYDGSDVAVTTDYRQVLSEILIRRMSNPNLGAVFPGYSGYSPLGIVQGADMVPNFDDAAAPTAITLASSVAAPAMASKVAVSAGIGVAATAGLVALRERRTS